MFQLSNVLNALATTWALVGCLFGMWLLIAFLAAMIKWAVKCFGGKKRES